MTRNTEKRVEVACPILDKDIKNQINHYMRVMLSDNVKARVLQSDGTYRKKRAAQTMVDSQATFMEEALQAKKESPEEGTSFFKRLATLFRRIRSFGFIWGKQSTLPKSPVWRRNLQRH